MNGNDPRFWTAVLALFGLVLVIVVGLSVIQWARRSIRAPEGSEDLLESFQSAFEAGEMDEVEYDRVRAALARGPEAVPPPLPGLRRARLEGSTSEVAEGGPPGPEAGPGEP